MHFVPENDGECVSDDSAKGENGGSNLELNGCVRPDDRIGDDIAAV